MEDAPEDRSPDFLEAVRTAVIRVQATVGGITQESAAEALIRFIVAERKPGETIVFLTRPFLMPLQDPDTYELSGEVDIFADVAYRTVEGEYRIPNNCHPFASIAVPGICRWLETEPPEEG
jgi:hypothetical protein